jgi:DNA polymerase-3 subunit epsilon
MDFAANFTAIDFETATKLADSACQLGAVIVREGKIVDKAMWMIRPEPLHFSRFNIQIHGITPQQVRNEPAFGDLWPQISEKLGDDCLVAHNANFDIGVLLACLRTHKQPIPDIHFTCTRSIARRTWPHHRRYGLKPLSNWLGVRFQHHDALEDSMACAKILLAAGIDKEAKSLEDLEKRLRLARGKAGDWGHRGPQSRNRRQRNRQADLSKPQPALPFLFPDQTANGQAPIQAAAHTETEIDLQRLMIRAEFIRPLSGMQVVFAGRLRTLSRPQAEALATRLGGAVQETIDDSTTILVVGNDVETGEHHRAAGVEKDKARQLRAEGAAIKVVDEAEFLGLVISPPVHAPR